jgi:hypothetical protein
MWTSTGRAAELGVQAGQPLRRADIRPSARVARAAREVPGHGLPEQGRQRRRRAPDDVRE